MNEEKPGQNPPSTNNDGDMLDRWIEQNLHIQDPAQVQNGSSGNGGNPPKIDPKQPAQSGHNPSRPPMPKPAVTGSQPHQQAPFAKKPNQPHVAHPGAKPPMPPRPGAPAPRGPHNGPHHPKAGQHPKGNRPQQRRPMHSGRPPQLHQPAKAAPHYTKQSKTQQANSAVVLPTTTQQPAAKTKSFFGLFNRPQGATNQTGPSGAQSFQGKLRILPFGGLDEVGKNCMGLEYFAPGSAESEIIIIDLGFQFPEEDMLGVDYVIPDLSYLEDKIDRIRGIVFTHGHLDHIGAVPYLVPKLNFPVMYGTKLTMGLVEKRLEEFGLMKQSKIQNIVPSDVIQLGPFNISFFHVNHSIPDAVGVVVKTPAGNIVHTGDFKFDHTPSGDQEPADFARIASLSQQNIAALFIDSTNALKAGHTITEKKIGESLEGIIKNYEGRIIIASFSSQIGRIQQIVDAAKKHGRTIFLSGRSLVDNVAMSMKLGYLKIPAGLVHDIKKTKKIPEHKVLILTTGSQGEDVSALTRMSMEEHASVKIKKGDTVVLSSSPIPGNERAITQVTNNLCRLGAHIINNQIMDVHTSGHAQQEDLKLMMSLVKAKYVVPVHGEYYMRFGNKEVAMSLGYDEKHAVIIENGDVMEIVNNEVHVTGEKIESKYILVDGLGVGDIGAQVMMDRQTLAENGVLIVVIPIDEKTRKLNGEVDIISRGFIYMKESEELVNQIKQIAKDAYKHIQEKRSDLKRAEVKKYVQESIDKFVHQKIDRHPLVLPVVIER